MKVFLTGSTGFVGSYVLRAMLEAGHEVRALTRPGSESRLTAPSNDVADHLEIVRGDITQPATLDGLLDGCDAVVHLVGIIREDSRSGSTFERVHLDGARNVIDAAKAALAGLPGGGEMAEVPSPQASASGAAAAADGTP